MLFTVPTMLRASLTKFSHACLRPLLAAGLLWACAAASTQAQNLPGAAAVPAPALKLHIVGGLAGLNQYLRNEEPFWSRELARMSHGKYSAVIVPFDRAGVPGGDMLRLLQLGVVPFGTVLQSSLLAQYPQYAATDLAGLSPDMTTLKKVVSAYRPYLEHDLRTQHKVVMLALYVYPAQVLFCKNAFRQLADLKGRRIRVASSSQADFLTALGAQPVMTGFAQIMENMASGNTECAVTGAMSGNTLGLHEVTGYIHTLPISWGLAVFGANQGAWDNLPPDLRALLSHELPKLEAAIWTESERETAEGLQCNTDVGLCRLGRKGQMTPVVATVADEQFRRTIFSTTVLPKWLARCGPVCADLWQQTIGKVTGIEAKAP